MGKGINVIRDPLRWQRDLQDVFIIRKRQELDQLADSTTPADPFAPGPQIRDLCFRMPRAADPTSSERQLFWIPEGFMLRALANKSSDESLAETSKYDFSTIIRPRRLTEQVYPQLRAYFEERDPLLSRMFVKEHLSYNYLKYSRVQQQTFYVSVNLDSNPIQPAAPLNPTLLQMLRALGADTGANEPSRADFNELFDTFGTHFIDRAYLGGDAEIAYLYEDRCEDASANRSTADYSTVRMVDYAVGGSEFAKYVADCTGENANAMPHVTCEKFVSGWRQSLYAQPGLLLRQELMAKELSELVQYRDDFEPDEKQRLRRRFKDALQAYAGDIGEEAAHKCHEAHQCDNGGKALSFTQENKHECRCACAPGFWGDSCEKHFCVDAPPKEPAPIVSASPSRGTILQCYQCNSNENGTSCLDEAVSSTEADSSASVHVVKCTADNLKASMRERIEQPFNPDMVRCRKVVQTVEGETITIRECAYLMPHEAREVTANAEEGLSYCRYRAGTYHITYKVCYCNNDLCNAAAPRQATATISLAAVFLLFLIGSSLRRS